MNDKLLNFFLKIQSLSKEEIEAIDKTMVTKQFKKGTILLKEGQTSSDAFFVLEGIVRQYCIIDGEEKTTDFFTDAQWVVSLNNINVNSPSTHFVECSSDCLVLMGDSTKGEDLYRKYPKLETIARKLMTNVFIEQQAKLEAFTHNSPLVRYQNLISNRPDLIQKVPQYQIASYIGVTPESLSRIRKRIF
jgi:CRP-like cAMP-binding protein